MRGLGYWAMVGGLLAGSTAEDAAPVEVVDATVGDSYTLEQVAVAISACGGTALDRA
jgi:hypothetical protein